MGTRDKRVDAYIERQRPFAQPILEHMRGMVHAVCPDVVETIKWSVPFFEYNGEAMCGMSAFKEHAAFGFWKAALIPGLEDKGGPSAGNFGRLTTMKDLPGKKALTGFIKAAMKLNEEGVKVSRPKTAKPELPVPPELVAALAKNKTARAVFEKFPPSHRREYSEWIGEAKRDETKATRVKQAVEWIAEGKGRNWKYHEKMAKK